MPRRVLITSALVALLLGVIVLAPGLPPVRQALLDRATQALENAGFQLDYQNAEGNAWRRVALNGVTLGGLDSLVTVDRLELRYHLPSLLGGELPLDVSARGVRGDIDLSGLEELAARAAEGGGAGGGLGPRVVLREIDLTDVELRAQNVPFTLPDATLSDLRVAPAPGGLQLGARLTTEHGEVAAEGRLALPSYDFAGTVTHADVAVAQRWWGGAIAGTASGPISVRRGQVNADVRIEGAVVEEAGLRVTDISGTARLRYPQITAELTGTGLNGPVTAAGTVDIAARRYDATGRAQPDLAAAAAWLAGQQGWAELPADVTGRAKVEARVTGWERPEVRASTTGAGSIAGLPFEELSASFDLRAGGAIRAALSTLLAGGRVNATVAPGPVGNRLELIASGVSLATAEVGGVTPGGVVSGLRARVDFAQASADPPAAAPTGTVVGTWSGELAGLPTTVDLDGSLDPDGLQAFFSAAAATGEGPPISLTGAAVFANERLDAGLSVADLKVPALSRPLRLGLTASGPLSNLTLGVTVDNERPVLLDLALFDPGGVLGATEPIDLRGGASGRLVDGAVRDVSGRFGPLSLAGGVELEPFAAAFDVALAPVRVRGGGAAPGADQGRGVGTSPPDEEARVVAPDGPRAPDLAEAAGASAQGQAQEQEQAQGQAALAATVSIPAGRLVYDGERLTLDARALVEGARAGPALVELDALDLRFGLTPTATSWALDVSAPGDRLRLHLDSTSATFQLGFYRLPVRLAPAAQPALLTGAVDARAGGAFALAAAVAPGSHVAGLPLVNGARLTGALAPDARRLEVAGTVGYVPVAVSVDWASAAAQVSGEAGGLRFALAPSTGEWRLSGAADLEPLLAEVGLGGLAATFDGSLAWSGPSAGAEALTAGSAARSASGSAAGPATGSAAGSVVGAGEVAGEGYTGAARVDVTAPVALTVALTGAGGALDLALAGELGGVPLSGGGSLTQPLLEAVAAAVGPASGTGAPRLLVDLGPLKSVTLDAEGVRGAGELPATPLGPATLAPLPWALAFDWSDAAGFVELSGSVLQVALTDGAIEASGELAAGLGYGGSDYRLTAWPGREPGERIAVRALLELPLGASLVNVGRSETLATFRGTPEAVAYELEVSLAELAAVLPPDYRPTGALTSRGRIDLLSGPSYVGELTVAAPSVLGRETGTEGGRRAARADSRSGAEDIHATFAGVGASFELDVAGAGLQVTHGPAAGGGLPGGQPDGRSAAEGEPRSEAAAAGRTQAASRDQLTLTADQVSLERFLPPEVSGVLDGSLNFGEGGWGGSLEARVAAAPVGAAATAAPTPDAPPGSASAPLLAATVRLLGAGETLELSLSGAGAADATFDARGTLLPELALRGDFALLDGDVTGDFTWRDGLEANLVTAEQRFGEFVTLPAQHAVLALDAASGDVTLTNGRSAAAGSTIDLRLSGGELGGELALPLQLDGEAALLDAWLAGTLTDPQVSAALALFAPGAGGDAVPERVATLTGDLASGADVSARVSIAQLARFVPGAAAAGGYLAAPLQAHARVDLEGRWVAGVRAPLELTDAAPLELGLLATGEGLDYRGELFLAHSERANAQEASGQARRASGTNEANGQASWPSGANRQASGPSAADGTVGRDGTTAATGATDASPSPPPPPLEPPAAAAVIASAAFAGHAADAEATLDLGKVAWSEVSAELSGALGVPVELAGGGLLSATTAPLAASLALDLTGRVGDNRIRLQGVAPDDLTLSLTGPAGQLDGRLAWASTSAGGGCATLTGEYAGERIDASLVIGPDFEEGRLELMAGGAQVQAQLVTERGAEGDTAGGGAGGESERGGAPTRRIRVSADVPAGSWAPAGGSAAATLVYDGATLTLATLAADVTGLLPAAGAAEAESADGTAPADAVHAELSGRLSPGLALSGTLATPRLADAARLQISGDAGLAAALAWRDLEATASLSDGARLGLRGAADAQAVTELLSLAADALPAGAGAVLTDLAPRLDDVDLSWSARAGWAGTLTAGAEAPWLPAPTPIALLARGDEGRLLASLAAELPDATARLDLLLPAEPWAGGGVGGELHLDVPLQAVVPGVAADLRLGASAEVSGTVTDPRLAGPLTLRGDLEASGRLAYHGGRAELELAGRELRLWGSVDDAGVSADAQLRGLPLEAWLPQLPGGKLSLDARLAGTQLAVTGIALTAPDSLVTGGATIDLAPQPSGAPPTGPTLRAALAANLDLAALRLGDLDLSGTLRGPLVLSGASLADLSSATLIANLAAVRVGVAGLNGSVSGNLTLGGKLADPTLNTQLIGDGNVRGHLTVDARPASGVVEVSTNLAVGQLATDLRVNLRDGRAHGRGSVRYGDALLLFEDGPAAPGTAEAGDAPSDHLVVTGAGRLAGLEARVAADLSRAEVNASLGALGSGLGGALHLVVDSRAAAGGGVDGQPPAWLSGTVEGAAVAGVALGDLTLGAAEFGAPITLQADHLSATLAPLGLEWRAEVVGLPLGDAAGAPTLSLRAAGAGAAGTLAADLDGEELALALEVRHGAATRVVLEGSAYGGEVLLMGDRAADAAWEGKGYLQGGQVAGFDLAADVTLQGSDLLPQLVLRTRAANGVVIEGNASVGAGGVTIDQLVSGGPLAQALRVHGRVLPSSDLTISSLELAPGAALSATTAAAATTSSVRLTSVTDLGGASTAPRSPQAPAAQPAAPPTALRASGALRVPFGPVTVELSGANATPELAVALLGLPGWRATTPLPATDLLALGQRIAAEGLELHGEEALAGSLRLHPASMSVELDGFGLEFAGVALEADGTIGLSHADVSGLLTLDTDLPVAERESGYALPWQLSAAGGAWRLSATSADGRLEANYRAGGDLAVAVDLPFSEGRIVGQLGLQPAGLAGTLGVDGVRLLSPELGGVTIDLEATIADGRIGGSGALENDAGRLTLSGSWGLGGLLPAALAPDAPSGGRLEARLRTLELSKVPVLARFLPHLSGEVSGAAQLRDGFVLGQLVAPELDVAGLTSPLRLAFSGAPDDLALDLQVRGGIGRVTIAGGELSGVVRFERFPLNLLAAAVVGPTDYTADLTGVMRLGVPLADPLAGYLRLATEEVRLERLGVATVGNVTVTFDDRTLAVEHADFAGRGSWHASGVLRPDLFDLRLQASDADFTPLLGLAPLFARLGVGAAGSFDIQIGGDAANPQARLTSPGLEVEVAGTRFRFERTEVALEGADLSVTSRLHGLRPVSGTLELQGGAYLSLFPFALANLDIGLQGALDLAGFGAMRQIEGALRQAPDGTPTLAVTGLLGSQPFTVQGTLEPLDLRGTGRGVTVALPALLVERALVDADLRLTSEPGGVALGGSIVAEEVVLDPEARTRARDAAAATEGEPPPAQEETLPEVEAAPGPRPAPSGGLAALRFDELNVRAPGRVTLATTLGSFEAGLDLTLTGTGAEPRLSGTATALRGNLRFSGREFTIDRAVATFTPNRGVFPELDVAARTEFDKSRVLAAAPSVSFVAPREGSTFEVQLAFTGPVEPAELGGFRFDVRPLLTSNALIEAQGEAVGASAARPFTEAELMSLVALGRFELNADLIGAGGLGEAVAQGALDTAVDLLVVSGLESALREALGLDVVEIRTSSFSSLLDEGGQPFGVSLRVGGYLNPELFASYRIGTYDGADPNFSLTNEVLLRYALGPLDLDLIGRLDFPTAGTLETPRPEVGVLLGYQFTPLLGIDAGVTLGTNRSKLEFGVTLRW